MAKIRYLVIVMLAYLNLKAEAIDEDYVEKLKQSQERLNSTVNVMISLTNGTETLKSSFRAEVLWNQNDYLTGINDDYQLIMAKLKSSIDKNSNCTKMLSNYQDEANVQYLKDVNHCVDKSFVYFIKIFNDDWRLFKREVVDRHIDIIEQMIPSCIPEKIHEMYQACWRTLETANYNADRLYAEFLRLRQRINQAKSDTNACSYDAINKLFEASKSWTKFAEECIISS